MKEVFLYYKNFLYIQHIVLYGILLYWIFKRKINGRILTGYFFFNFLATSGSMSHIKYVMDVALKTSFFYKGIIFLIFSIGAISIYFYLKRKNFLFFILEVFSLFSLFFIFKKLIPQHLPLYIWEVICFYLFLVFVILFSEDQKEWKLRFDLFFIFFLIVFLFGAAHNEFVSFPESFLLSPVGILPVPTLLITIGFLGLNKNIYTEMNLLILLFSLFILFSSPSTIKFYKIVTFTGAVVLTLRRFFERET